MKSEPDCIKQIATEVILRGKSRSWYLLHLFHDEADGSFSYSNSNSAIVCQSKDTSRNLSFQCTISQWNSLTKRTHLSNIN